MDVASNTLNFEDITPTQCELGLWNDCPNGAVRESIANLHIARVRTQIGLWANDRVKVVDGLERGATGIVELVKELESPEALVFLDSDAPGSTLAHRFYVTDLQKYFVVGDCVKVMDGREQGRNGWVVKVDADQQEIVFSEHGTFEEVSFSETSG